MANKRARMALLWTLYRTSIFPHYLINSAPREQGLKNCKAGEEKQEWIPGGGNRQKEKYDANSKPKQAVTLTYIFPYSPNSTLTHTLQNKPV